MNRSDQELIAAYLDGDRQTLDILVARHYRAIWMFARRLATAPEDAEDITQETFIKVWRHLKKFDPERNFKTWLLAIARNTALDFLKKKKAVPFSAFETDEGENPFLEAPADATPLPHEMLERKEAGGIIKDVLKKLSSKHRATLVLRYSNNLTFRAIAEILAEPLHTIKSRNRRALAALTKFFPAPIITLFRR